MELQCTHIFNDDVRGTAVLFVASQLVVALDNICQLVGQVILRGTSTCRHTKSQADRQRGKQTRSGTWLRALPNMMTAGRTGRGATGRMVAIIHSGLAHRGSMPACNRTTINNSSLFNVSHVIIINIAKMTYRFLCYKLKCEEPRTSMFSSEMPLKISNTFSAVKVI